jgi:hypothetical protein
MFSHLKRNWMIQTYGSDLDKPKKRKSSGSGTGSAALIPKKRPKLDAAEKARMALGKTVGVKGKANTKAAAKSTPPRSLPYVASNKMSR